MQLNQIYLINKENDLTTKKHQLEHMSRNQSQGARMAQTIDPQRQRVERILEKKDGELEAAFIEIKILKEELQVLNSKLQPKAPSGIDTIMRLEAQLRKTKETNQ